MSIRSPDRSWHPAVTLIATVLVLLSLTCGCEQSQEGTTDSRDKTPDAEQDQELAQAEVEKLRALPYAGYVKPRAGLEEAGVVTYDRDRASAGYTLYVMNDMCTAELIDMDGHCLRTWRLSPGRVWNDGELLPNGDFIVVGADTSSLPYPAIADESRLVMRFDWHGELLWKRSLQAHHDISVTPDGRFLCLTLLRRHLPEVHQQFPVCDDCLTLLTQDGEPVDSLCLYDLVRAQPDLFPIDEVLPDRRGGPMWVDLFHCNSAQWIPDNEFAGRHPVYEAGNVLICSRHQDRIAVIDWERKKIVWAWGRGELSAPHDAHLLENGNILVFDNGLKYKRSRIIEMNPVSGEIVWKYRAPQPHEFFTFSKGTNQRLPNGNTLIANADSGQLFEVTPEGAVVWDFRCPHTNEEGKRATIFGAKRYALAYVDGIVSRSGVD